MYNVLDISKYVINYSHDIGASITNLKLQKILYYIQAAFLVNKQEKCFAEPIVAWEFGPVSVETYNQYLDPTHYYRLKYKKSPPSHAYPTITLVPKNPRPLPNFRKKDYKEKKRDF